MPAISTGVNCQAVLLLVLLFGVRDAVSAQSSKNHTLYLLALLSYPSNFPSIIESDVNEIAPGAYLAVSDINNRTDVLADYRLELITADGGCSVDWVGVISLIYNLYYAERKQIVGIVGPECSDAAKALASLTGRPEMALLNVHLGNAPELANRTLYPYSYGIFPSYSVVVDSIVALFQHNNWTRAGVLYTPDILIDYSSFVLFQKKVDGIASLFMYPASLTYLPLEDLRRSYVRVIVSFLRNEILQRVLCLAYYKNMTYPNYQWILFEPNNDSDVSFIYQGELYECSKEQLVTSQFQHIELVVNNPQGVGATISHIGNDIVNNTCPNTSSNSIYCYALFDIVWALAQALNNSIEPLRGIGLSLSNYTYGKYAYTQIVKQQMNMLSFNGLLGAAQFNSSTGYICNVLCTIYNYHNDLYSSLIGNFTNGILAINSSSAVFVSTNFEEKLILVSNPLAVIVIIVEAVAAVLVMLIHILNTVYSHHKSIKASSTKLNHFAYIGCYANLIGILLYTIIETFDINMYAKTVLCNVFTWAVILGLTLVLGTISAKTWRLYHIFKTSLNHKKISKVARDDRALMFAIVVLVSLSAVLCLTWTSYDHLVRKNYTTLTSVEDALVLVVKQSCSCTYEVEWIVVGILYEATLVTCSVYFAFSSRNITIKEFQSHSVILLAYLLTLTSVVGGVIYYITKSIGAQTDVPYGILSFGLMIIVYLCVFLLFLPPVLPVIKEWPVIKNGVVQRIWLLSKNFFAGAAN